MDARIGYIVSATQAPLIREIAQYRIPRLLRAQLLHLGCLADATEIEPIRIPAGLDGDVGLEQSVACLLYTSDAADE